MDIEHLIIEIEMRPFLWDVSHSDYKDRQKKREGWMEIANAVIEDFESKSEAEKKVIVLDIINRWRTIRDNYVRSQKKRKSAPGAKRVTKYLYEKHLRFLQKCKEPRASATDGNIEVEVLYQPDNLEGAEHSNKNDQDNDENYQHLKSLLLKKKLKMATKLEDKPTTFMDSKQPTHSDDDEDMTFYRSTLPIIKTFCIDEKIQFRIQLMQLLQNIKQCKSSSAIFIPGPSSVQEYS